MRFEKIPLDKLIEPRAPLRARIDTEYIERLAGSLTEIGLKQPIKVFPHDDLFEVIFGHCRLLACRLAKLDPVPCLIKEAGDPDEDLAEQLHENIFRRDMTVIEEAVVYAELYEKLGDTDKVAAFAHVSRNVVESRLAILSGDDAIRDALHDEQISLGVAEQLNKVPEENTRRYLLSAAIRDGASVEKVRLWVKDYSAISLVPVDPAIANVNHDPAGEAVPDPNICWLCGSNEEQSDLRVRLVHATCERIARRDAARIAEAT